MLVVQLLEYSIHEHYDQVSVNRPKQVVAIRKDVIYGVYTHTRKYAQESQEKVLC